MATARASLGIGLALALALPPGVSAGPALQPPLRAGEAIVVLADNCSLILDVRGRASEGIAQSRRFYRRARWRGDCRNGLVHGVGALQVPASQGAPALEQAGTYHFGREEPVAHSQDGLTHYRTRGGAAAAASAEPEFNHPVWRMPSSGAPSTTIVANGDVIAARITPCAGDPGCRPQYGIEIAIRGPNATRSLAPCPDLYSAAGCEVLWRQLAAPFLMTYRQVRDQALAELPAWRAEISRLNAPREARLAALDQASLAAVEWTQVAARTETAAADHPFKSRLDRANAGELYALADERRRAGDNHRAAQALRALLTRFPDHALAVTAAQQLSSLGPAAQHACDPTAEEARLAASLREALGRIPRQQAVRRIEAVLYTIDRSVAAYARCGDHPDSEAKIRSYSAAYVRAARLCAEIAPGDECRARRP